MIAGIGVAVFYIGAIVLYVKFISSIKIPAEDQPDHSWDDDKVSYIDA